MSEQVLSRAQTQFLSKLRTKIQSISEYVETALQGEFNELDESYHACQPEIMKLLEAFLRDNEAEFIERVD